MHQPNQMDMLALRAASQSAETEAFNYRMLGDRRLAKGWRERALDNIAAIKLSHKIEQEGRPATETEQALLMKFVGFGASDLANSLFPNDAEGTFRKGWEGIGQSLNKVVSGADMADLARSVRYAHYTPEFMVKAMWRGLKRLGFTGGKVLEPGCGTGLFFALMPEGIASRSQMLGFEADPTTARIARLLYPESDIIRQDFTKASLPYGFDLAIGNPPFATDKINNDASPTGKLGLSLHDYFIARSIERLRPGGVAAFVVSRWTMDKANATARRHIASMANLVGAFRMPEGAMRADAGTDVCVDILFFQKRQDNDTPEHDPAWVELEQSGVVIEGKPVWINSHFVRNPASVLGIHDQRTSQIGPIYTCRSNGSPINELLSAAMATLPAGIYEAAAVSPEERGPVTHTPFVRVGTAAQGARIKEGSYFVDTKERDERRARLFDQADRSNDKAERRQLLREANEVSKEIGTLYQIIDNTPEIVQVKAGRGTPGIFGKTARVIRDMIPVREAVRDLLRAQEDDTTWAEAQDRLNRAYDHFVEEHGPINDTSITEKLDEETGEIKESVRYPNLSAFRDDPDAYLVAAIEIYDQQTGEATKGPIFSQRVIQPPVAMCIESPADALAVVLNESGKVDMPRIAELLKVSESEAAKSLRDLVYFNPGAKAWNTTDEYLSGAVREKLAEAREAAKTDAQFERNVVALEAIQPIDLLPSGITARLGAPWIPVTDVVDFSREIIGVDAPIFHTAELGLWSVDQNRFKGSAAATVDWGTKRRHAGLILQDALQNATPVIYDEIDNGNGGTTRVQNAKETQAAQDKFAAMKQAFVDWVWTKPERAERLAKIYNEQFNNLVPRSFNGDHLVLPGASSAVTLRRHQKRAIWRMICSGSTYLAHAVGAGKTMALIASLMEQRRLGLIKKPMVVVPGHTLAQWAREFLTLYPNARILVADEDNFAKDKRARFIARAATGNWDAIIITHPAFKHIAAPYEFEERLIKEQIEDYDAMLKSLDKDDRLSVKKIEALKEKMKRHLEELESGKDDSVTIEEMGIDHISVDEAQEFRKLTFSTNLNSLKGVDPKGSGRAWDLYVKARFLEQKQPNRALNLASGTPITNTMGEMFTLLRFLHQNGLVARHVHHFDAWISTFGESKTELELQASGQYKAVTRLSEFVNIPELSAMFLDVADVVLTSDLGEFVKLPQLRINKSGKREREVLSFEAGTSFRHYQKVLAARIKAIEERGGKPEKGDDIILVVINDGRHAAIDMRLVDPVRDLAIATKGMSEMDRMDGNRHALDTAALRLSHQDNPDNKLNGLIDNAFKIWQDTADLRYTNPATGNEYALPGAAQMIFSDLGTEAAEDKRGFSAYSWIRRRLIDKGVPADQIAIMQHYKKTLAKQRLFNDVNSGRVRFLLGSSETMGTGVNAQQRLIALHHLDAPYLPSLVEQREGRIIRQGNQNEEVMVFVYTTLGSMDATMWQILERKARFIDAVLRGDKSVRRLEDLEGSQADQFAMAKAMASGDTRLLRKAGLEQEIARLNRKRSAHYDAQSNIRTQIRFGHERIETASSRLNLLMKDLATRAIPTAEEFNMIVEGQPFTDRAEAGDAMMKAINTALLVGDRSWCLAEFAGFRLEAETWIQTSLATGHKHRVCYAWLMTAAARIRVFEMDLRTGEGIIQRMERDLRDIERGIEECKATIEACAKSITDYEKRKGGEFDLQAELDEKVAQWAELEASLAANENQEETTEKEAA